MTKDRCNYRVEIFSIDIKYLVLQSNFKNGRMSKVKAKNSQFQFRC